MWRRKLQFHKGSYYIILPREVVERLGLSKGDEVVFELNGEGVLLRKSEFRKASDLLNEMRVNKVYTIGYEGKDIDEFIEELIENGIERLIDVREAPLSRKNGFSKSALMKALNEVGIEYKHFSTLGAPREARHSLRVHLLDFDEFAEIYREHLNKHLDDLKALETYISLKKSAIMCFEADWRRCHRSIIAEYLEKDGFEVIHL